MDLFARAEYSENQTYNIVSNLLQLFNKQDDVMFEQSAVCVLIVFILKYVVSTLHRFLDPMLSKYHQNKQKQFVL